MLLPIRARQAGAGPKDASTADEDDMQTRPSWLAQNVHGSARQSQSSVSHDISNSAELEGLHGGQFDSCKYSASELDVPDDGSYSSAGDSSLSSDSPSLEEGHPFYRYEAGVIRDMMVAFRTWHTGVNQGQSTETTSKSLSTSQVTACGGSVTSGKRNLAQPDRDEDQAGSVINSRKRQRASRTDLSFACPFCKKDPRRYRICYRYRLSRIGDVKQHINRCHRLPVYCPLCMEVFATESLRDEHIRARSCPTKSVEPFDGVTEDQKKLLARRISSKIPEEEQWYAVFEILFPDHPRPLSPYIDQKLSEELGSFQDFMASEGLKIIREHLQPHINWAPDHDGDLEAFQNQILGQCLQRLFDEWERTTSPSSSQPPDMALSEDARAVTEGHVNQDGVRNNSVTCTTQRQAADPNLSVTNPSLPWINPSIEQLREDNGAGPSFSALQFHQPPSGTLDDLGREPTGPYSRTPDLAQQELDVFANSPFMGWMEGGWALSASGN